MFKISKVFGNDMVLQRDEVVRVWGWSDEEGGTVAVDFKGLRGSAVVADGEWTVTLDGTLPADTTPADLAVTAPDGGETIFTGVLVGDVYMVIGQSNIRYPLEAIINGAPEGYPGRDCVITDAENIRLNLSSIHDADGNDIYPPRGTTELCPDVRNDRGWQKPSEGALAFSALGYFVGQMIVAATENALPVGLVEIDADGQSLNAFMPNELAEALGTDELVDGVYKGMWHIDLQPTRYVYNQFIYPFQKMPICGIVWYQGESDFNEVNCPVFAHNYAAFITELRRRFDLKNHREFPVCLVEIPSSYLPYEGWPADQLWAYIDMGNIRCEMGRVPNLLPNSYLAASSDLWLDKRYWNSLHPYCKYPQARRVADILLAVSYGKGDLEFVAGPQMTRVAYDGDRADVAFRYVAQGLTSAGSSDILGFEVRTPDGNWIPPEDVREHGDANGDGVCDSVELRSSTVITGVRYNAVTTNSFPENVNLCSGEGVPAIAFSDLKPGVSESASAVSGDDYLFVDL